MVDINFEGFLLDLSDHMTGQYFCMLTRKSDVDQVTTQQPPVAKVMTSFMTPFKYKSCFNISFTQVNNIYNKYCSITGLHETSGPSVMLTIAMLGQHQHRSRFMHVDQQLNNICHMSAKHTVIKL